MNILATLVMYGSMVLFYYVIFVAATLLVPSVYWRAQTRSVVKTILFFYASWWFWQMRGLGIIDGSFTQITMTSIGLFITGIYCIANFARRREERKEYERN